LGIITKLTLDLQPTFLMKQVVYLNMPMGELERNAEAVLSAGYSVSLFTTWKNQKIDQVWIKSKINDRTDKIEPDFYKAVSASKNLHPLEELSAEHCTDQLGVAGPWYERMPHFKMGFTPSSGTELQTEYFIPFEYLYKGIMAIEQLQERISPLLYVSEIRAIAADDLWMSPFYKRKSVAFHFTWKQEWEKVKELLPLIEEALAPFHPRPHWGKLFSMKGRLLQGQYERLHDFTTLMTEYDAEGKFKNEFIASSIF
jgi:xylitol oxidase